MTDREIFLKAIDKAKSNGWVCNMDLDYIIGQYIGMKEIVIFSQDFAQAYWKNEGNHTVKLTYPNKEAVEFVVPGWQWCLAQMAMVEDRLEYLSRFFMKD